MDKDTADKQRRLYAQMGKEHPRAMVLVDQMKHNGCFVRGYATTSKVDGNGYYGVEEGWERVAKFIHNQICQTSDSKVEDLLNLNLGELASFWAKAAGGMRDPLNPND